MTPASSPAAGAYSVISLDSIARAQLLCKDEMDSYKNSALTLDTCVLPGSAVSLLCDYSLGAPRPIVPANLVPPLLAGLHGLAHPGGNAFLRDVRPRYVWRHMASQVKAFCRACIPCQRSKITRHTKAPLHDIAMPDHRFAALHLDLVGPLPCSEGYSYLLTVIDRFSRWIEAIPLQSITAQHCATALLRHWVARFGVPASIVTDRGRQFTSGLWLELSRLLGISLSQTTAYHPQSNGMIERQHRTLKDRLVARACATGSNSWMDHLPFVLLGLRSSIREDSACSPSDLLYGTHLRLPGDLLQPSSPPPALSDFALHLRSVMKSSAPMPVVWHGSASSRVDPSLERVSHVFVRVDAVKRPLVPPYDGPFPVLKKSAKTFDILKNEKTITVSIDRLKPAFFLPGVGGPRGGAVADPELSPPPDVPAVPVFTASGRVSRPVSRFQA